MIGLVLRGVVVACNSLKTITTNKIYQRIDYYYCMLIYTQSLIWPSTRPHYSLNFGSEKMEPRSIKLATRGGVEDTRLEAKAKDTKKSEAKDSLSEDRHSRGQGQECSRPRPRTKDTKPSALQKKKKKKVFTKIFQAISTKKFFKRSTKF